MKKRIWIALLCLNFVFAGCGNKAKLHVYEYPNDDSSILNYTGDSYDYPKVKDYIDDSALPNVSYNFRGTQYELAYYETSQKQFIPYEEENYKDLNGVEFSFKKGSGEVCGIRSENGLHISDLDNPKSEEEFRQISDSFVKDFIVIENYTCFLTTEVAYFQQEGEKATRWYEKKDSFYTEDSEIESVQYIFIYRKYLNDFKTNDTAKVVLNPDGTLDRLVLANIGAFEEVEKRLVQQDTVKTAVLDKITAICPEGYQVEDMKNDVMACIDETGKLFFYVVANPTFRVANNNGCWQETCRFIVAEE